MIDEELYKIATDELNSDDRNPAVWARACALASDDHDEARFLYTNLRVEEMLNKDGKQRTFSTTRSTEYGDLSKSEPLDTLELSLSDDDAGPSSSRTGVSNTSTPLPIDDILSLDSNNVDTLASVAGNAVTVEHGDTFDDESIAELEALEKNNRNTTDPVSSLTGKTTTAESVSPAATILDADTLNALAQTPTPSDTPEVQRAARLSEQFEQQAQDMSRAENALKTQADTQVLTESPPDIIRTDYADNDILDIDDDPTLDLDAELGSGQGKPFLVFNRNGALKAIKRGVSWPALLFTFPWLLSKAMFGTALVYACLWIVSLAGLYTTASLWLNTSPNATLAIKLWTAGFALLALVGLCYIPFRYGNSWVARKLQNRGYEFESAVKAGSKRDAIVRLSNLAN